jgi:hypothetical protein
LVFLSICLCWSLDITYTLMKFVQTWNIFIMIHSQVC